MQVKPIFPFLLLLLRPLITGLLACFLAFTPSVYASEQDVPAAGQLTLFSESGETRALHLGTHVDMAIKGLHARVTVTQEFKNNSNAWVNALYTYPLPDDSAVHDLRMQIGERIVVGEIHEKIKAQKIYQAAKKAGKKTALLEQLRPNLFSQKIANIAPGEILKITVGYIQPVLYEAGNFRLRLPMTLTPRFIPGVVTEAITENANFTPAQFGWAQATDLVPDAHLITPPWENIPSGELLNPISLQISLDAGVSLMRVHSDTHAIDVVKTPTAKSATYAIRFSRDRVSMDRDFELVWSPAATDAPVAALFHDLWQGDNYVQLLLMPPRTLTQTQVLPRELLLVIDTSGSMGGASMRQAKDSALIALETLKSTDRFNLIDFNTNTHSLFAGAVEVSPDNLDRARRYIRNLSADGGTNMKEALARAFSHAAPSTHLQQIVFVTDGSVGNEAQLLTQIRRSLHSARLFTVAIGSAPNRYFMREAAKFGRGSFTEISTAKQVRERMTELLHKLENPIVSNVKIEWPQPVEAYPRIVPDLYWGEPLLITAKLKPWPLDDDATVIITGVSAGQPWRREVSLQLLRNSFRADTGAAGKIGAADKIPTLAKHFARKKINHVESLHHDSRNSSQARNDILTVALNYKLMSRFTSLVAVDKTPVRPDAVDAKHHTVPNAKPHGSSLIAASYPKTAAGLWLNILIGFAALLALLLVRYKGVQYA